MGEQPMPKQGYGSVTEDVIADLRARERKGIQTYGTTLQYDNGRDALRDAYEEQLDGAQYLRQAIGDRDDLLAQFENEKRAHAATVVDLMRARGEIARLRAVVEALPRCVWPGCDKMATHAAHERDDGVEFLCADHWDGDDRRELPYRAALSSLEGR